MPKPLNHIDTKLIHSGEPEPRIEGAVIMPVFQTAMFEYAGAGFRYIRLNNTPNHIALHKKLAALENAEDALVTSSGMSAISTALLAVLAPGDHFLTQESIYGGTYGFITSELARLGITFDFIGNDSGSWEKGLRPNTRAIYVETMTNPLLEVIDLKAVVAFAKANKLVSLIDNTFATPINFRPPVHGFDLSIHSCTKYLNGHSDIIAGAVIGNAGLISEINRKLTAYGGSLDPHACFLLHRGIKTLALRMRCHNENTLKIAQFLEGHPKVEKVIYPGLESHPDHKMAKGLFEGFSGILSFELKGGVEEAERFISKVKLPACAPSLGGVETLIIRPSVSSHAGMPPETRRRLGISDKLIRVSVGIEAAEDLIEDFDNALKA